MHTNCLNCRVRKDHHQANATHFLRRNWKDTETFFIFDHFPSIVDKLIGSCDNVAAIQVTIWFIAMFDYWKPLLFDVRHTLHEISPQAATIQTLFRKYECVTRKVCLKDFATSHHTTVYNYGDPSDHHRDHCARPISRAILDVSRTVHIEVFISDIVIPNPSSIDGRSCESKSDLHNLIPGCISRSHDEDRVLEFMRL
jgi:hypothetical protein